MGKYVYWNENLEIREFLDGTQVLVINKSKDNGLATRKNMKTTYTINESAAEIITLINGTRTYDEIISFLASKYNEENDSIRAKITPFIKSISNLYNINIMEQQNSNEIPVNFIEKSILYPSVASIELTNKCNIKCMHCYGDYGNAKDQIMSLDNAKLLLTDLKNVGVRIIELTGGEITVHPHIKEILLHAIDLNFDQISFLTNGVSLSDEVMEILIENKEKVFVQIDMHSLNDDYLTWFTKVSNTLNVIRNKIIRLAENKVKIRVATIVTHKNINEISDIADWVHSLGIGHYGVSPVVSLGRASNSNKDLYLNKNDTKNFEEILEKINFKYKGFLSIIDGDRSKSKNCGCLTSHCVISSNGDVKICTMDNLEYFNSSIGNVFEKSLKYIYNDNSEYINSFFNISSPKMDSQECKECEHKYFCHSCLLRGLFKAKEMKGHCVWYINKVPSIVKEKLYS